MSVEQTPAVTRALIVAAQVALAERSESVTLKHLLRGLLAESEGRPAQWLAAHGCDLTRWPATTRVSDEADTSTRPDFPFAPAADRAVHHSRRMARAGTVDRVVTTEHLLMAVLQSDEELLQDLKALGLRYSDLEREWQANVTDPVALDAPLDFGDVVERSDTARILDACGNRAREALRVIEDYARFVLDDAFLSRQLKDLRHDLAAALADVRPSALLSARDTLADVGTDITTPGEHVRSSVTDVVSANAKRLQEALRSLEEYGKLHSPDLGRRLERLRYSSYTLERALVLGAAGRTRLADAKVYVLVSSSCRFGVERTIAAAADGGAAVIQLREKGLTDREFIQRARAVRRWTRSAGVLFIVNDRPDIARLADADGVHLGQDDLPVREARRILGPDAVIGVSTHDLEQVRRAVLDGASYIGVGPTFPSQTKTFADLAGLAFVRAATAETSLPAFVLGGVTVANVGQVVAAGARRVAVSAAVTQAEDPRAATLALRAALP